MEIKKIISATEFSLSYRIILCDLWGVIHNGVEVFSNAKSYLEAMKAVSYTHLTLPTNA